MPKYKEFKTRVHSQTARTQSGSDGQIRHLIDLSPQVAKRSEKAAVEIQKRLSMAIAHLADKRFEFFQVTSVKLSADLSHATIYFSSLHIDSEEAAERFEPEVKRLIPLLRKRLSHSLTLRKVPNLSFRYDPRIRYQCDLHRYMATGGQEGLATSSFSQ